MGMGVLSWGEPVSGGVHHPGLCFEPGIPPAPEAEPGGIPVQVVHGLAAGPGCGAEAWAWGHGDRGESRSQAAPVLGSRATEEPSCFQSVGP